METSVGTFAIAGATLAQIIHDFGSVEGDCDGILFGRLQHQTTSSIQDDEAGPAIPHEQITARVTGYYCTGRVQSFYDSTGRLDHSKLLHIVRDRQGRGEDPLIGWYLGRRNSAIWPSMREAAVTSFLRSGVVSTSKMEADDSANLISPELKNLQIGSVQGVETTPASPSISRRIQLLQAVDSQTGRAVFTPSFVSSAELEFPFSPGKTASPGKWTSSTPSPRQDKRVESVSRAPLRPCFFVLFTESDAINTAVHTHEYRAFQSLQSSRGISFEPLPVNIVNAGLSFREFYDSFVPVSSIPSWFNSELNPDTSSGNNRITCPTLLQSKGGRRSSGILDNNGRSSRWTYEDGQEGSDSGLQSFAGEEDSDFPRGRDLRVSQFENLYQQMLSRLERLSTEAYESSVTLHNSSRSI